MTLSLFGLCMVVLVGAATRRQAGRECLEELRRGALLARDWSTPRLGD